MTKETEKAIEKAVEVRAAKANVSGQEYIDNLKRELVEDRASRAATNELQDLVNLIVITHQQLTELKPGMEVFANQFIDQRRSDKQGNGNRYIKHYIQEGKEWSTIRDKFVPTELSNLEAMSRQFIKFKNDDGSLAPTSKQWAFPVVWRTTEMITYFIDGQLGEYIEDQIIGQIQQSIEVKKYDYIMGLITADKDANKGKVINGTATNLFDALTTEVFPECEKMLLNSHEYNYDNTLIYACDASHKEDLVMLVAPTLQTKLKSNIMSQLFNSKNIEIKNFVGDIHVVNNKFRSQDGLYTTKNASDTGTTSYLDENTIIVIDKKNYLKILTMLEFSGEQDYPLNMSHMRVIHLWLASGKLGWGKLFIYKNQNLMTMPGNETLSTIGE